MQFTQVFAAAVSSDFPARRVVCPVLWGARKTNSMVREKEEKDYPAGSQNEAVNSAARICLTDTYQSRRQSYSDSGASFTELAPCETIQTSPFVLFQIRKSYVDHNRICVF